MIEKKDHLRTTLKRITMNYLNNVNYWQKHKIINIFLELDLELSESSLMSKMERKKQFVTNMQAIQDKK